MGRLFKNREDRHFASIVSRVVYCNPFTAERVRLESEALGEDYDASSRDWNLDPEADGRHQNMSQLYSRIRVMLEDLIGPYLEGEGAADERAHYTDMVVFLLYIQYRNAFDKLIEKAHQSGIGGNRVSFYNDFLDGFTQYFGDHDLPVEPAHLFSCYYQIRRAFYHIFQFFVGKSPAATRLRSRLWQSIFTHDLFRYQRSLFRRIATIPTLIHGPSGSGKEVVARAIGFSQYVGFDPVQKKFDSDFTSGFYPVNLSALSPTLIESELFGHRKGAFTGAISDRQGYFSACGEDGTVFLDEIGDTDMGIQVKLLRVLQTRQFQRLGDVESETFTGKIVAATNLDLMEEMRKGRFREDFYFRLRSDVIETISLKEMIGGDIEELEFLADYASTKMVGKLEAPGLTADFMDWVRNHKDYPWKGNFRELEQALRSILLHGSYDLLVDHDSDNSGDLSIQLGDTGWTLKKLTQEYVREVYRRNPVYEEVARLLQVDRRTVKRYLTEE